MGEEIVKIEGGDGQVCLYQNKVTISRKGIFSILSHGFKADKDIILKNIISVEYQPAGFSQGSFSIETVGATNKKDYTVKFPRGKNKDFLDLKERIITLIADNK